MHQIPIGSWKKMVHNNLKCIDTRSSLKIRSTPTDGEAKAQMKEWMSEKETTQVLAPAISYGNRTSTVENSQDRSSSSSLTLPLPTLDLPNIQIFFRNEEGRWPACRTTVHKWYYTEKCTRCTKCTSAM